MDQGFEEYKPPTDASTVRVAAKKMTACVLAYKICRAKIQSFYKEKQSAKVVIAVKGESTVADLNEYLKEGDADEVDAMTILVLR